MEMTYAQLLERLTDMRALSYPAPEGEKSGCCSSYDRRSRYDEQTGHYVDWDANDDGRGVEQTLEDGTVVAAQLEGPGVIWRSWSAMPNVGPIRVYVDGECVIDRPFIDYFTRFGDDFAPLNLPSVCPHISRGYNSFMPIPFNKSLRIELLPGWGAYYHFTYTLFAPGTVLPRYDEAFSVQGRVLLAKLDRTLYRRGESRPAGMRRIAFDVAPGQTQEILAEQGNGAIARMELSLPAEAMALSDRLTLRMYWDGEQEAAVCAPACDFFACTPTAGSFRTWVSGKTGDTLYANWHMPFAKGARITLTNEADMPVCGSAAFALEDCPDAVERMRFFARWQKGDEKTLADPAFQPGGERWPDWAVLRTEGAGRFCGMHLMIRDTFPYPEGMTMESWWLGFRGRGHFDWWWGEGDEKFFVDGERFPSTYGTGSEDYFGYAWAAEPPFAFFDSPFAAMSDMPLDGNGDTSVCRFHVCDNVPFQRSFEAYLEKYKADAWGEGGTCLFFATPFWYQMTAKE